jgi:hypothetical protein
LAQIDLRSALKQGAKNATDEMVDSDFVRYLNNTVIQITDGMVCLQYLERQISDFLNNKSLMCMFYLSFQVKVRAYLSFQKSELAKIWLLRSLLLENPSNHKF